MELASLEDCPIRRACNAGWLVRHTFAKLSRKQGILNHSALLIARIPKQQKILLRPRCSRLTFKSMVGIFRALTFISLMFVLFPMAATADENISVESLYRDALEARQQGDFRSAISFLEKALIAAPKHADLLLQLGILYGFEKQYDTALRFLDQGLAVAPDYPDMILAKARILTWQGQYERADRLLAKLLVRDPRYLDALMLRARLAYYKGDNITAAIGFEKVISLDPSNIAALLALGDSRPNGRVSVPPQSIAASNHPRTRACSCAVDSDGLPLWT